jgi:hypothetical protein
MKALPARRSFVASAFKEAGLSESVATWMATNLVANEKGGYRWQFDVPTVDALLSDYWAQDLRPVAENPPGEAIVHMVRAGRSNRWSARDLAWLANIEGPRTRVHGLEDAGHWLHVDEPEALLHLLAASID